MSSRHTIQFPKKENLAQTIEPTATKTKRAARPKRIKCKTGCFTCRRRKKKCNEVFPVCSGCSRNYLECIWPAGDEVVPKDFAVRPASSHTLEFKHAGSDEDFDVDVPGNMLGVTDFGIIVQRNHKPAPFKELVFRLEDSRTDETPPPIDSESAYGTDVASPESLSSLDCDDMKLVASSVSSLEYDNSRSAKLVPSSLTFSTGFIPNVALSQEEALLYHTFITGFIPSVSPEHANPLLSPGFVFVPEGSTSEVLREIFFACGAYILAYNDPARADLAMQRYSKSIKAVQRVISSGDVNGTEDWLFVAIQSLCLRDRAAGLGASRCAKHIAGAYNLIQQRSALGAHFFTPGVRTLLDSFVFNYTIVLYLCTADDIRALPSPFAFFDRYREYLQGSVYSDELAAVPWLDNPVMGSSFSCFEIAAKLFWLLRMHGDAETGLTVSDEEYFSTLARIRFELNTATAKLDYSCAQLDIVLASSQILPDAFPKPDNLRVNLCLSRVMLFSLEILYAKMIDHTLAASCLSVQNNISQIVETYTAGVPQNDHSACLALWALFIGGTAAIDPNHQFFFSHTLREISRVLYSDSALKLALALEHLWDNEVQLGTAAFDVLLTRTGLEGLSF
ncbi:unnamed protein product [Kuraishia capsulata CBS 1993]|uniref:Zn(2)-C6 fungal-type domain-containing protein n=1 Tax=Kuraishia capsulata CBS 1993 TaxID=1382522 RepID=W6MQT7_9ASCO|nr:uncharacterized protein KUCA_T00003601001 [Kuraishia capsulata CBS 1993]CDK27622.1 unnamed protein product [Kuraishia capsulata CBS 1993]